MSEGGLVLVTGGAKRLGAAIARAVAAAGYRPVIHYGTSRAAAEALAAELGGQAIRADLADAAHDDLVDVFGRNAGAAQRGLGCCGAGVGWLFGFVEWSGVDGFGGRRGN